VGGFGVYDFHKESKNEQERKQRPVETAGAFRKACFPTTIVPDDIRSLRNPITGFFGLMAD
jgi:hypothetical protein